MPEDFDPNGLDIEAQLRRYADRVEAHVADVVVPSRPANEPRRWPIYVAVAAALLLVVGLASVLLTDGEEGTDPVADPDVVTEDDDDEPQPGPESDEEADDAEDLDSPSVPGTSIGQFPLAPLAARHSPLIVLVGEEEILVWGGYVEVGSIGRSDLAAGPFADGAIFNHESLTWRPIADGPLPPVTMKPAGVVVDDDVIVAAGRDVARYRPAADTWESLPRLEFAADELFLLEAGLAATSRSGDAAFLALDGEADWTTVSVLQGVLDRRWTSDGSRLIAGVPSAEGLSLMALSFGATTADPLMTGGVPEQFAFYDVAALPSGEIVVVSESGPVMAHGSADKSDLPVLLGEIGSSWEVWPRLDALADGAVVVRGQPRITLIRPGEPTPYSIPFPAGLAQQDAVLSGETWWSFGLQVSPLGTELTATSVPGRRSPIDAALVGDVVVELAADERYVSWTEFTFGERIVVEGPEGQCDVVYWTAGEGPAFETGVAGRIANGLVHVRCDGGQAADLFGRVFAFGDVSTVPLITVPAVEQLFADTAMQTLRNAGLEPVVEFEVVAAGSSSVGRVIDQEPAAFAAAEPGATVTITVGESAPEEWQPVTDRQARRVVDGFLTALAAEEWEIAAAYMENGAADPQFLLDQGMPEGSRDLPLWIADWCEDSLCGAAYEIGNVVRDGNRVEVEVSFQSSTGVTGTYMRMSWFEGIVTVDWLPPPGAVGPRAPTTAERLFGSADDAGDFIAAWANHQELQRVGSIENGLNQQHRTGGTRGAAGTFLLVWDEPIIQTSPDGERVEVSPLAYAGSADIDGPVVFTYDFTTQELGVVALDSGVSIPDDVLDTFDREASAGYVSVGESSIVFSVGAEETGWLEVYDRDGYAATGEPSIIGYDGGALGSGSVAPDDSSIVAFAGPEFGPARSVAQFVDGSLVAEWTLPVSESFIRGLDFDGRWIVAPLESGRLFVVDTEADTARVVDVYAEVWFD